METSARQRTRSRVPELPNKRGLRCRTFKNSGAEPHNPGTASLLYNVRVGVDGAPDAGDVDREILNSQVVHFALERAVLR